MKYDNNKRNSNHAGIQGQHIKPITCVKHKTRKISLNESNLSAKISLLKNQTDHQYILKEEF